MTAQVVHESPEALAKTVAIAIGDWIWESVEERGVCHWVLAGGTTPAGIYARLASYPIPWHGVHCYFSDERCVPADHEQSNFRSVEELLFVGTDLPASNVHRMRGELGPTVAAVEYTRELPERFDLVLLGLGEDGHTASLFPGNAALELNDRVVPVFNAPKPPPERISLGFSALNAARRVVFLATGSDKADAVRRVLGASPDISLPATRVRTPDGELSFHIDRAAASKLE